MIVYPFFLKARCLWLICLCSTRRSAWAIPLLCQRWSLRNNVYINSKLNFTKRSDLWVRDHLGAQGRSDRDRNAIWVLPCSLPLISRTWKSIFDLSDIPVCAMRWIKPFLHVLFSQGLPSEDLILGKCWCNGQAPLVMVNSVWRKPGGTRKHQLILLPITGTSHHKADRCPDWSGWRAFISVGRSDNTGAGQKAERPGLRAKSLEFQSKLCHLPCPSVILLHLFTHFFREGVSMKLALSFFLSQKSSDVHHIKFKSQITVFDIL